ncbi:chemotaxis protein CheW [Magnetospirillum sp. SS-4]|uniref:chemotaxis protein CheW n=1 Tax=Magnetospirillum sp. SS-4 TaxID=2681465 RepID=UPI00138538A4|nr:chemotaxis protein CheW [Magnetospirillum sp. SS-4]CAA7624915.1 Chemotaxis signal transduction protein [Magnetospirillum sp. SS-4]
MAEHGVESLAGVVTFRLCGQTFGLAVGDVREVVPVAWLDRPPRMPGIVQGVLNLAGTAIPVLRLDRLLGLEDGRYGIDASILVMRDSGDARPLGLLVEHVDGVRAAEAFSPLGMPEAQSFNGCVVDQLAADGGMAYLLSWRNVLLAEERARLADFQACAQERLAALADDPPRDGSA